MQAARILVLGSRKAAIDAAIQMNLPIVCVHNKPLKDSPEIEAYVRVESDFYQQAQFSEASCQVLLKQLKPLGPFQAIIPLGEPQVWPAAKLAQLLNIPHPYQPEHVAEFIDKALMKQRIQAAGLPCTDFYTAEELQPDRLQSFPLPMVIKKRVGSGSRGLQIIESENQRPAKLEPEDMLEAFVSGREFSIESFVSNGQVQLMNTTQYTDPKWENLVPGDFSEPELNAIAKFNQKVILAMGVTQGLTHLEVFETAKGLVFGEIALRPPGGHIMDLMSLAYQFDAWQSYFRVLLDLELDLPKQKQAFAAVRMLHPGAGVIAEISGKEAAAEIEGAVKVQLKAKPGQNVKNRLGVGQELGHLIAIGPNAESTRERISQMKAAIEIKLKDSSTE